MIRLLKGVTGYRGNGSSYRYSRGDEVNDTPEIEYDLVKNGIAEPVGPGRATAIAPQIQRATVVNAVVKRGRLPRV